jgi:hypothetical protein
MKPTQILVIAKTVALLSALEKSDTASDARSIQRAGVKSGVSVFKYSMNRAAIEYELPINWQPRVVSASLAKWPFIIAGLLWLVSYPLRADEAPASPECISTSTSFDGVLPIVYATVTASSNARIYLHKEYPRECGDTDISGCGDSVYLVNGDRVAIGKTCGSWAYVQFLGLKRVSVGWVASGDLVRLPAQSPKSDVREPAKSQYVAALKKGRGIPVCEAYLQRLNQTQYELPPYCGRPENDSVPGFESLTRIWVPTAEINRLLVDANKFVYDEPANFDLDKPFPLSVRLTSYGFRPNIIIENDGIPKNVVLWNLDNREEPECNSTYGPVPYPRRSFQVALILSSDGSAIDRARTNAVFSQPAKGPAMPGQANQHLKNGGYSRMGNTYGVFEYRGVFYFDTFFDNGPNALQHIVNAKSADIIENRLGVFVSREHHTAEICEYQVNQ